MANQVKPSIPKGTRDFGPIEMAKRNYIFNTIKEVYALFGYQQIETPSMENLSTLMGKYGEEGDKLLFKILDSGNFLADVKGEELVNEDGNPFGSAKLAARICEKGLRYDLTVPFARFVTMHKEELCFPFKRYQIQPVWRADRPQKGRYREFFQCDADVVGSDSLLNEVELIQIIDEVYRRFGFRVCIKMNNRKILAGIAEVIGAPELLVDITVAIDKLDKIGLDGVNKELTEKGLTDEQLAKLQPIIALTGSNCEKLSTIKQTIASSETGVKGVEELEWILAAVEKLGGVACGLDIDLTLARGLNYYTGAIFEVKALDVEMGSINGGGRYDNLTGVFGMPGMSGVGISFGADRIYDVLNTLNLYPEDSLQTTQVLFVTFGQAEMDYALPLVSKLRQAGIRTEIYPEAGAKMKKQMGYANQKQIPYVVVIGGDEVANGEVSLKNMITGTQTKVKCENLISQLQ